MKKRFEKSKDLLRREGFWELIKRSLFSIIRFFFKYKTYYLYENNLNNKFDYLPRIENYTFRIVSRTDEVDDLIADGLNIKSYYAGIDALKERIREGAILFSFFANRELAHTSWVAATKTAKEALDLPYVSIDYQKEAYIADSRTNPKYQRLHIYSYVYLRIFSYLQENNISKAKYAIVIDNIPLQKAQSKLGSTLYGKLRYLMLFKRHYHKEAKI